MEFNQAKKSTIDALSDVEGWATITQIVKRGGHSSSVDYLLKSGYIEFQTITPKTGYPLVEYKLTKSIAESE
jgi:predicted DNA-binding ArsR family transcriptional regulator